MNEYPLSKKKKITHIYFNSFGKIYTINIGTVKMDPTKMKRAWSPHRERERERIAHNIQTTFGDLEISKLVNRVW